MWRVFEFVESQEDNNQGLLMAREFFLDRSQALVAAKVDESSNDREIDLNRAFAPQHCGKLCDAVLSEGIVAASSSASTTRL